MGCRIIEGHDDSGKDVAVFYCSTTGVAFGPVMEDELDAVEIAEQFLKYLEKHPIPWEGRQGTRDSNDPRAYPVSDLMDLYAQFRKELEAEAAAKPQPTEF